MTRESELFRQVILGEHEEEKNILLIGIRPPLSQKELEDLPGPGGYGIARRYPDGSMSLLFTKTTLSDGETLVTYAEKIVGHLGHCSLDTTIRKVGEGSLFEQVELEQLFRQ